MPNPSLLEQFCSDGQKDAVSTILQTAGWSPENPNINGYQLNTIFNEIFTYLNYLKNKGLSFWEDTKTYKATAGDIDIVRYANKIYFAKQDSNLDGVTPKTPDTNPTYWGVLYDLDNPILKSYVDEQLALKALLGGSATQLFKAKAGVASDDVVNKGQLDLKANKADKNQCTAFVNFDGTDGTIRDSFNISSVVRNAQGDYTITFSIAMDTANYTWSLGGNNNVDDFTNTIQAGITTFADQKTDSIRIITKRLVGGGTQDNQDHKLTLLTFFGGKN